MAAQLASTRRNTTFVDTHRRFRDANPEEIEALTLEGMRAAVMAQLHAGNLEVSVVGDLEPDELEVLLSAVY